MPALVAAKPVVPARVMAGVATAVRALIALAGTSQAMTPRALLLPLQLRTISST
jgi:hypothetical protein